MCNPRVLVFVFLPKPKPKLVTPSIAHATDVHHAPCHGRLRGLRAAGAQRRRMLGGAGFFKEACLQECTVENIVDVRRPQVEQAVDAMMRQFQEEIFEKRLSELIIQGLVEVAKFLPDTPGRFLKCRPQVIGRR